MMAMDFLFLNPMFLVAGAAAVIPIWLHLRRRDDAEVLRFPTTRFLDSAPVAAPSSRRLEDLFHLLFRLLALSLAVICLAWPYDPQDRSGVIPARVMFILDNSLSHSASGGFERARDAMISEIEALDATFQVAALQLTDRVEVLGDFGATKADIVKALRQLEPSSARGNYVSAFLRAAVMMEAGGKCDRQIRFFTDSQANQWKADERLRPFLKDIAVRLIKSELKQRENLAVTVRNVDRIVLGESSKVRVDVNVKRYAQENRGAGLGSRDMVRVSLRLDGKSMAEQEVLLDPESASGNASLVVEVESARPFESEVRVEGERDALSGDSAAWVTLPPVRQGVVEVLSPSRFLRVALSAEVMKGFWEVFQPVVGAEGIQEAPAETGDVLVVDERMLSIPSVLARASAYLGAGKGVLLFAGGDGLVASKFIESLGVAVSGTRVISEPLRLGPLVGRSSIVGALRAGEFSGMDKIGFSRFSVFDIASARALVQTSTGAAVVSEVGIPNGKLLLFGSGFERFESDWPLHVSFIPFLDACMTSVREERDRAIKLKAGEEALVPHRLAKRDALYELRGNTKGASVQVVDRALMFRSPVKAGVYSIAKQGDVDAFIWLAVNADESESDLTASDREEVPEGWFISKVKSREAEEILKEPLPRDAILRQRLGRLLMLVAAGLMLFEPFLALRRRIR